jgi:hypothetical protein
MSLQGLPVPCLGEMYEKVAFMLCILSAKQENGKLIGTGIKNFSLYGMSSDQPWRYNFRCSKTEAPSLILE